MNTNGNAVLITGGATGLGYALARKFVDLGNEVAICGRRQNRLDEARSQLPGIITRRCDISRESDRASLYDWIVSDNREMNILVNNAGIQRPIDFRKGVADLQDNEDEIDINLKSQIYLAAMFIPFLMRKRASAIINISSGLGFAPMARFPVYSATKAAMHSFSISLRLQLRDTPVRVFEAIPPTIYDAELKGKKMEKSDWSISSSEMADAIIDGIKNDRYEIYAGQSADLANASREGLDKAFQNMNRGFQ